MNNFASRADHQLRHSLPDPAATVAAVAVVIKLTAALVAAVLLSTGCSRHQVNLPDTTVVSTDSQELNNGFGTEPPELPVNDFKELGFSLNAASFGVVPDSATRRIWPNGYQLESAIWRGENGFPRIMINVLDVSQSGESFSRSSQLIKPNTERINDLLPGEEIDMHTAGQLRNDYGRTNFQMFTIDSQTRCAFMNQFLTQDPAKKQDNDFGEIIFEAILCDQNTTEINRPYLERFTNAYRIGKPSLYTTTPYQ